jgi:hypothetical protein
MSKEHLEALAAEAHADKGLALEVGGAYSVLARVEGISTASSPWQRARAEESLRRARFFVEPVVRESPQNRKALLTAARISHQRMMLAENESRNAEAVAEARRTAEHLERLLALGELSAKESETVSELYYDIALSQKNQHRAENGIRYARRSADVARWAPHAELRRSLALSMLADLLRLTGDLEGALLAIREARANLEEADFPNETERRSSWCRVLGREGKILGAISGFSLNRPAEAAAVYYKAFHMLEEWRQSDPGNTWTRLLFGSLGRELGDVLRARDPERALAVYDYSISRVREVSDNPEARRAEAELLAASSHPLRRLKRTREAGDRIAAALRLLGGTSDYPAGRIAPHSATYEAVRASGDHLSESGQTDRALQVYEELLGKVMAAHVDPDNDLRHAAALSDLYGSLAGVNARAGLRERAQEFSALRLELWQRWDRKLPNKSMIRRQLALAGA